MVISVVSKLSRGALPMRPPQNMHIVSYPHTPVKVKPEMLVLVRGIIGFTVRVVGVLMGLFTRLAVLATWMRAERYRRLSGTHTKI